MEVAVYAYRVREKLSAVLGLARAESKSANPLANAFNRGRVSGFKEAIKIINRALHKERPVKTMTDDLFLERFELWKKALGSSDPHSLVQQMYSLCWRVATYESIRASWKTEMAEDGDTLNVSPLLFHFITNDFSRGLCLDLRRLTEVGNLVEVSQKENDRSVYSLASLIADIKENREKFTRRRLFAACKLEYDVDLIRRRHDEFITKQLSSGQSTWSVPHDLWTVPSEMAHTEWDRLCHCTPPNRSPNDVVALDSLNFLEREVSTIRTAVDFLVNKYFAHAATPESRESAKERDTQITINQLKELTVKCGRLINSVSSVLQDGMHPFLGIAAWNKWEDWGRGWAADPKALEEAWQAWADRVERLRPLYPE